MKSILRFFSVLSVSPIKRLIFLFFTFIALSVPTWGAYYVAGSFNSWNAAHNDYKMHNNNSDAKLAVVLDDGTHTWKVTNGSWDKSWGGEWWQ